MAGREQHEAGLRQGAGVRAEDGQGLRRSVPELELDAVAAAEDVALGGERELVPVLQLLGVAVVLLEVGRDPQEPGRAADQPHLVVAAPAAAVLDLDRGQRRLAGVAPVDGGVVAVDQPRLEQGQEQPLRPAVLTLVGAVEDTVVVEGEAEPFHLPEHALAALGDPVGRRLAALDRRQLGRQAEGVEAEAEQDGVAAGAAVTGVGVADRVVAHVAHVQVARGERARGLDVGARLSRGWVRRLEIAALLPDRLPVGLDPLRVVAGLLRAHLLKANSGVRCAFPRTCRDFRRASADYSGSSGYSGIRKRA